MLDTWIIREYKSKQRSWYPVVTDSELIFNWEEFPAFNNSTFEEIYFITKKNNSYRRSDWIHYISSAIYNSYKIRKNHIVIIANFSNRITKIGVVVAKTITNDHDRCIRFSVEWKKFQHEMIVENREFPKWHLVKSLEQNRSYSLLSGAEFVKSPGDSRTPWFDLMFFPEDQKVIVSRKAIKHKFLEDPLFFHTIKDDTGGTVKLFFGTNRNRTGSENPNDYFGNKPDGLSFGTCMVNIPKGHMQGEVERPFSFWVFKLHENEEDHVVLKSITEVESKSFFDELNEEIALKSEKAALIFLHGYNTSFAEASRRAAQITWDVPFNGISGFYSWPSQGNPLLYRKDIKLANASVPCFEEFITRMMDKSNVEKLHIIAHSMGSRLLLFTIKNIFRKTPIFSKLSTINQLVLAAPDFDQIDFQNNILPYFSRLGSRRTLYASDKDLALKVSEYLRGGLPRLGEAGDSIFVAEGLDTIDASNVESNWKNHSYIFDEKELLTDLFLLLKNGDGPLDRRLRPRKKFDLPYWLFPA